LIRFFNCFLANIFKEEELTADSTVANFATVQIEGDRTIEWDIEYFNLDVIISVGYGYL
jgi:DNA ligase (NAD+)